MRWESWRTNERTGEWTNAAQRRWRCAHCHIALCQIYCLSSITRPSNWSLATTSIIIIMINIKQNSQHNSHIFVNWSVHDNVFFFWIEFNLTMQFPCCRPHLNHLYSLCSSRSLPFCPLPQRPNICTITSWEIMVGAWFFFLYLRPSIVLCASTNTLKPFCCF